MAFDILRKQKMQINEKSHFAKSEKRYLQREYDFHESARSLKWCCCHGANVVSTGVEEHTVTPAKLSRVARLMQCLNNLGLHCSCACGRETGCILHDAVSIEASGNLDDIENHF